MCGTKTLAVNRLVTLDGLRGQASVATSTVLVRPWERENVEVTIGLSFIQAPRHYLPLPCLSCLVWCFFLLFFYFLSLQNVRPLEPFISKFLTILNY